MKSKFSITLLILGCFLLSLLILLMSISGYGEVIHIEIISIFIMTLTAIIFLIVNFFDASIRRIEEFDSLGLINAYPARSIHIRKEYEERFRASTKCIDFFGFGLRALREDFINDFDAWLDKTEIRVLLIDPVAPVDEWTYADQRDYEENNHLGSISSDVKRFIEASISIKNKHRDKFEIRLYRSIPAVNFCKIDDVIFWGPYLIGKQSRSTPTFLINNKGKLFAILEKHYNDIWDNDSFSRSGFRLHENGYFEPSM